MAILVENRRLRLKVILRGPKLWVNLILNVIGVRLRFIGTHFDHNRYIIRIYIFLFFYRSLWSRTKVSGPRTGGVPEFSFHKLLFWFVVSNPFNVLEVGKKLDQNFPIYHPSLLLVMNNLNISRKKIHSPIHKPTKCGTYFDMQFFTLYWLILIYVFFLW